jgi:hypothetical protein
MTNVIDERPTTMRPLITPSALRCSDAAWDCEAHSFFGAPDKVAAKLSGLPDDLIRRRVYMLLVQGDDHAEVRIFERFSFEDAEGTIALWNGESLGDLANRITELLVANHGVHCPGEQVTAALHGERQYQVSGPYPVPRSTGEAFASVLEGFGPDSFVQANVIILC